MGASRILEDEMKNTLKMEHPPKGGSETPLVRRSTSESRAPVRYSPSANYLLLTENGEESEYQLERRHHKDCGCSRLKKSKMAVKGTRLDWWLRVSNRNEFSPTVKMTTISWAKRVRILISEASLFLLKILGTKSLAVMFIRLVMKDKLKFCIALVGLRRVPYIQQYRKVRALALLKGRKVRAVALLKGRWFKVYRYYLRQRAVK
ncbi:hypothetical protein Tco_1128752 [Tanacetum coccineum]